MSHFELMIPLSLPAQGQVWKPLGRQVVDHCRRAGIKLNGYDESSEPDTPTKLPIVLLTVNNARTRDGRKIHAPFDDLGPAQFTAAALSKKRFTGVPYPLDDEHTHKPFIRLGRFLLARPSSSAVVVNCRFRNSAVW